MSAQDDAKALVNEFSQGPDCDVWPTITKNELIDPLIARIDKPDTINQKNTSLCGPADFVRDLAIDRPVDYVKTVISLYKTGQAKIKDLSIKPGPAVKQYRIPSTKTIAAVDWIIMASIRDSDNWFFDYQSAADDVAAVTTPHRKEKWLKEAGYSDVRNEANLVATKGLDNARAANNLLAQGYKIALLINMYMIKSNQKDVDSPSFFPDHWIALKSPFVVSGMEADPNSSVSFECYTWGAIRPVPYKGLSLNIKHFLWNYYGYVAAKM